MQTAVTERPGRPPVVRGVPGEQEVKRVGLHSSPVDYQQHHSGESHLSTPFTVKHLQTLIVKEIYLSLKFEFYNIINILYNII